MRVALVVCVLVGCRFHFEETTDAGPIAHTWSRVAIGGDGTCGLTTTGEVWCWGLNGNGNLGPGNAAVQPIQRVDDAADWTSISVGAAVSCGVRAAGELWCWGRNDRSAIPGTVPDMRTPPVRITNETYTSVSAAASHACAVSSGNVLRCWGDGELGQLGNGRQDIMSPPSVVMGGTNQWLSVSTSIDMTCGVQTDHSLWCWGRNNVGQVGDGSTTVRTIPTPADPARKWLAVASGDGHTCAIEEGGQVWCWGNNAVGQLGDGTTISSISPVRASSVPALVSLRAGRAHTCGVDAAGTAWCWGLSEHGQFGTVIAVGYTPSALRIADAVTDVGVGGDVTCFVDGTAQLRCTGSNNFAQVALPSGLETQLTRADARTDWARIFAQPNHACGLTTNQQVYCWGVNQFGELGINSFVDVQVPRSIGKQYVDVAVGTQFIGGLAPDGSYWLAGRHFDLTTLLPTPTQYASAGATKTIALGENHGCRILANDTLECGGANFWGQLGDGTMTNNLAVNLGGSWRLVAANLHTTCAVTTANALLCWGYNDGGQLGNGDNLPQSTPTAVDLSGATGTIDQLALGITHTCVRTSTGEIWCWGDGTSGQLGNGSVAGSFSPLRVGTDSDWSFLASGDSHACALKSDHSLWCWGHADRGQIGEPLTGQRTTPTKLGGNDWADLATGHHFTCALKLDGTRWCTGDNVHGELGDGKAWREQFIVIP